MEHLQGKVAFITGAAIGIGFGIACACAAARMKVVMADVRSAALESSAASLAANDAVVEEVGEQVLQARAAALLAALPAQAVDQARIPAQSCLLDTSLYAAAASCGPLPGG
jgi:NAD(P)-dependent dehydrogenase (short-subunit alcohol dehydrogenase family)